MRKFFLLLLTAVFYSCAGTFTSNVTPGYETPPPGSEIAITYLDHADVNISNTATEVLINQLLKCKIYNFMKADSVDAILQKNNISIPRRLNETFLKNIHQVIPKKFLLTGGITKWNKGSIGFPVAKSTEVGISLTMYDLETGKVVWTVSGEESGGSGIFSDSPESKSEVVIGKILRKWKELCKSPQTY